ncbi:MAG: division/cell wall cluster transcriptional repressor MraZ [Bacteroidota bacterium]
MTSIVGQHDCKADAKGRISLPSSLKNKLIPFMGDDFVIKRSAYQQCLELHPKVKFDDIMKKIMAHPNQGKQFQLWLRKYTAGLKEVPIDSETGRLQIPRNLFEYAGIEKEVVLNASHNMIEIWDKQRYEAMLDSMSDDEFEKISESIFNSGGE